MLTIKLICVKTLFIKNNKKHFQHIHHESIESEKKIVDHKYTKKKLEKKLNNCTAGFNYRNYQNRKSTVWNTIS